MFLEKNLESKKRFATVMINHKIQDKAESDNLRVKKKKKANVRFCPYRGRGDKFNQSACCISRFVI